MSQSIEYKDVKMEEGYPYRKTSALFQDTDFYLDTNEEVGNLQEKRGGPLVDKDGHFLAESLDSALSNQKSQPKPITQNRQMGKKSASGVNGPYSGNVSRVQGVKSSSTGEYTGGIQDAPYRLDNGYYRKKAYNRVIKDSTSLLPAGMRQKKTDGR